MQNILTLNKRLKFIKIIFATLFAIFLLKVAFNSFGKPAQTKIKTIKDRALRGSIISSDGYTIARSIKKYNISIHTKYLDPNKKDFFLKLLSIYTNIPVNELEAKFYTKEGKKKSGWIVLAKNIDAKTAIFLKDLKYKLNRFKVFRAYGINKNFYYGLTITQTGESREYPLKEAMSPILGYTREVHKNNYTQIVGYNGIEKFYEKYLNKKTDGFIEGKKDAVGYILYTKNTKYQKKQDGLNAILNISLGLQKNIDLILDYYKEKLGAKEIIAAVMRSKDSKILAITSSNRYDPLNIKPDEIENLQPKATTYAYEPGSVLKPITYAIAINKGIITPFTNFNTYNGKMRIDGFRITDDEPFSYLNAKDIIVHSSNIGISQIAWKIGRKDFRNGLINFGLGDQKSGIDIGKEARGKIYSLKELKSKSNFATTAYGYGIKATFAQLLKAYNVFNNDGYSVSPRAVNYLIDQNGKKYILKKDYKAINPISKETANIVKNTLIEVVNRGTGKKAKTKGLEIGGKTGTAMIYRNGQYGKNYHSSFFGFANDDKGNKYTIGILVIEPSFKYHFASQSAVPVFKKIVDALIERDMLKPNLSTDEIREKKRQQQLKEQELRQKQIEKAKELKQKLKQEREKIIKEHKKRPKKVIPKPIRVPNNEPDLF